VSFVPLFRPSRCRQLSPPAAVYRPDCRQNCRQPLGSREPDAFTAVTARTRLRPPVGLELTTCSLRVSQSALRELTPVFSHCPTLPTRQGISSGRLPMAYTN